MGFNRVAFVLNDMAHEIAKSPRTAAALLATDYSQRDTQTDWKLRLELSRGFGEPNLHGQALEILPSFHADFIKYYRAGGNCIAELPVHKTYRRNGKKYIVLEAPEWDTK